MFSIQSPSTRYYKVSVVMPQIPFDPRVHQKVRYTGNRYIKFKKKLFVVHAQDYDLDKVPDDEYIIIHIVNNYDIVTYNKSDSSHPIFVAKKSELIRVPAEVKE